MQKVVLGKSGLMVSPLCFGTLTLSPLQKGFSVYQALDLMCLAYEKGITFFDTAQLYETYAPLKLLLKKHPEAVISTKSYAYDRETAKEAFEQAQRELDKDVVDLFMLHEQESPLTLKGHREAFDFYLDMKAKGKLRAVGVSTHKVACAAYLPRYQGADVLHPLINMGGIGMTDGSREDMEKAILNAHQAGIGIFAMKPLGGGHLIKNQREAFRYLRELGTIDSVAVGMQTEEEMDVNIALFQGLEPQEAPYRACLEKKRRLLIQDWCQGCGQCVKRCGQGALTLKEGQAVVDGEKCVLCGYCAKSCPEFCIKVI